MSDAAWRTVKPYVNGGLSGMGATCVIQPLDSACDDDDDAMTIKTTTMERDRDDFG